LMYTASGSHVRHAWIAGRELLADGKPTTMDEASIHARAAAWATRLAPLAR
jgi:5-methylthioadenosine/S-adenosylhomocysteine deaminase